MIIKTITPDRSKIVIEHEDHVKYWTRHFGVSKDELTRAIERVGNSAAAVRKQLSSLKTPARACPGSLSGAPTSNSAKQNQDQKDDNHKT
jgi:predicted RNA-binding protein YlqC (UPF0109 family)